MVLIPAAGANEHVTKKEAWASAAFPAKQEKKAHVPDTRLSAPTTVTNEYVTKKEAWASAAFPAAVPANQVHMHEKKAHVADKRLSMPAVRTEHYVKILAEILLEWEVTFLR
ncbi:MAG: hypothetical protein LBR91_01520 [Puniceicoccales bacterium]|jgi:hypothetical protein|nr:hypothetical protein [Puniceicoccales bacterium]